MPSPIHTPQLHWFAARHAGSAATLLRFLDNNGVRSYVTKFAPGIVFIRSEEQYASSLLSDFWGRLFFYRSADRNRIAPISDREMDNFILVTSASDALIPLGEVTSQLLQGDRVRVTGGLFEGAEGVVKRIKGDRRLIVSIDGVTAVATCYIAPEFLTKIQ